MSSGDEENLVLKYREAIRKRDRANKDIKACEEEYLSLLITKATEDILQHHPDARDMVESLIVEDNGAIVWDKRKFKAVLKDGGMEVSGNAFNVDVVVDGEKYSVNVWNAKYEMEKKGEYKIKYAKKKVRETLNRLLPLLLYLSANFEKLNPRELRKIALQKLSK